MSERKPDKKWNNEREKKDWFSNLWNRFTRYPSQRTLATIENERSFAMYNLKNRKKKLYQKRKKCQKITNKHLMNEKWTCNEPRENDKDIWVEKRNENSTSIEKKRVDSEKREISVIEQAACVTKRKLHFEKRKLLKSWSLDDWEK